MTAVSLEREDGGQYLIGQAKDVADALSKAAKQGDVIRVEQGDLALQDLPSGIVIIDQGDGIVTLDGDTLEKGLENVTQPQQTPSPEVTPTPEATPTPNTDLPKTGEHGTALPMVLLFMGAGVLVAAVTLRKQRDVYKRQRFHRYSRSNPQESG